MDPLTGTRVGKGEGAHAERWRVNADRSTPGEDASRGDAVAERVEADVPVLALKNVSKSFAGTTALRGVSLDLRPGEIHALVGQNGSGKSTLIKTLAAVHPADPGSEAWVDGKALDLPGGSHGAHEGLRFVHQDLGLVLELSAIENLALVRGFQRGLFGRVRWREQARTTRELLARFGVEIDIGRPLSQATPVERTLVAIAASLQGWDGGTGVLVMDEPTAVLPPREVQRLFDVVREVQSSGASVLYVSHRLDEIFELGDRVSVLCGGELVFTGDVSDLTPRGLASLMVGHDVDPDLRTARDVRPEAGVALEVRGLSAKFVRDASFELRQGEILGLAGIPGSGREEVPYALAGALGANANGEMRMAAAPETGWLDVAHARDLRIPLVPADRASEAVVAEFSLQENLTLSVLDRLQRRGAISRPRERALVEDWTNRLQIKSGGSGAAISTLSGGNQQKVIMARCLAQESSVLLLCEPTAGVDIGTRVALYEFLAQQAEEGLSILVSGSDVDELLAICSRVLVFRDGAVAGALDYDELTHSTLVHAMEGTA